MAALAGRYLLTGFSRAGGKGGDRDEGPDALHRNAWGIDARGVRPVWPR